MSFLILAISQKYGLNSNGLPEELSLEFLTIQMVQKSFELQFLQLVKSLNLIALKCFTASDSIHIS